MRVVRTELPSEAIPACQQAPFLGIAAYQPLPTSVPAAALLHRRPSGRLACPLWTVGSGRRSGRRWMIGRRVRNNPITEWVATGAASLLVASVQLAQDVDRAPHLAGK